jgi:sodium-dependent dicarboxylate transporter 2/3/5
LKEKSLFLFFISFMKNLSASTIGLFLGPLAFISILFFATPDDLSPEGVAMMAATSWVAIWWITEAVPIAATSLLPLVLFPLLGVMGIKDTSVAYADPMVLLYMGGFMIAVTIEKWNLHKRIALAIISVIGTDLKRIILGFMVATAFLSMWISNTATALMMLPIGMAVVGQLGSNLAGTAITQNDIGKALMLGIAYSASIGGMATIIGTPTNIVLVGVVKEMYGVEIGFADWMMVGVPVAVGLLMVCWLYLTRVAFSFPSIALPGGRQEINRQVNLLGRMSTEEKRVLAVFVLVSFCWMSRTFLLSTFVPVLDDTIIALVGALLLFLIPASKKNGDRLLDWKTAEQLPWGILLLFGGGVGHCSRFSGNGAGSMDRRPVCRS